MKITRKTYRNHWFGLGFRFWFESWDSWILVIRTGPWQTWIEAD